MSRPAPQLRRELGGPPTGDEDALIEWLARRHGISVAEVREAREGRRETRATPTGDLDLDRVRARVEAALDAGSSRLTPARRPARRSTSRTTSATTSPSPAADRAVRYGRRTR